MVAGYGKGSEVGAVMSPGPVFQEGLGPRTARPSTGQAKYPKGDARISAAKELDANDPGRTGDVS